MNTPAFSHFAIVVICLAVNATVQIASRRLLGKRLSVFRSALFGFICGVISLSGWHIYVRMVGNAATHESWWLLGDAIMYSCAGYCWLHYVNIGEASVRLRMAREILDAEPRGLTMQELARRYGIEHIIDARLERLTTTGELAFVDGSYYFKKPRMLVVARVFSSIRRIVLDDSFPAVRATKAAEHFGAHSRRIR